MITDTTGCVGVGLGVGGASPGTVSCSIDGLDLDDGVARRVLERRARVFTLWVMRSQRLGSSGRSSLPPVSKEYTVT